MKMPKLAKELGALEVKRLTTPGLHFVGQVPGLALQVLPTGGRTWVLRSVVGTRRRDMGLGGYPEVGLADARTKARSAREQIKGGVDPIAQARATRSALRAAQSAALTFEQAASRYIATHRPSWRNAKHAAQWEASLTQYAYPHIGQLNVADIGLAHILNIFEQEVPVDRRGKGSAVGKLWEVRTATATRLRGRIEAILDWAKGRGHRSGDNPAAWKGNLDAQLARPERIREVVHHRAMPIDAIGEFLAELRKREGMAARALEFAILTAARSGEVRGMRWGEIDGATWVIPANRMKAGREHRVPLPKAALRLLEQLPRFEGEDFVFPAARGGTMSDMALTSVMRRMGRNEVPHGFRSTFRDWAAERTNFPNEMAELALAHTISNAVEASYRRGDMFEKRRRMMDAWAAFCFHTGPSKAGEVIKLRDAA
jgi:integrase